METPLGVVIDRLLDTSTVSNWMREAHQMPLDLRLGPFDGSAISFQTEAELLLWTTSPTLPAHYRRQVHGFLEIAAVLHSNSEVSNEFARILRRRRDMARPENVRDAWIAATALAYDLPLITFDRRGFNDIPDLDLILLRTD